MANTWAARASPAVVSRSRLRTETVGLVHAYTNVSPPTHLDERSFGALSAGCCTVMSMLDRNWPLTHLHPQRLEHEIAVSHSYIHRALMEALLPSTRWLMHGGGRRWVGCIRYLITRIKTMQRAGTQVRSAAWPSSCA